MSDSTYATDAETSGRIVRTSGSGSPLMDFAMSPIIVLPALGLFPASIS